MFFLSINIKFLIGLLLNFLNVLIILIGIKALLLSFNLNFIYLNGLYGQILSFFILLKATSESAFCLTPAVTLLRLRNNIFLTDTTLLKILKITFMNNIC